ncbi:hypothetical protein LCGC14_2405250 [marine sediment metagenome]|uniref:Uncharacterized protein n=1 Tax=marine sediment metagenome TaxID=412755 RepID=A0A0F9BU37_9ZZZZ
MTTAIDELLAWLRKREASCRVMASSYGRCKGNPPSLVLAKQREADRLTNWIKALNDLQADYDNEVYAHGWRN